MQDRLSAMHVDEWLKEDVFTFRWWLLIALILLTVVIWWFLLEKSRLKELLLFTALGIILSLGLNEYGEELVFWDYPTDVIAIFPPLSSINLLILPLSYSLAYQHFAKLRSYVKAVLVVTAVICFAVEPLFARMGLYRLLNWQYHFSYLLFIAVALTLRLVTKKVILITEKSNREKGDAL